MKYYRALIKGKKVRFLEYEGVYYVSRRELQAIDSSLSRPISREEYKSIAVRSANGKIYLNPSGGGGTKALHYYINIKDMRTKGSENPALSELIKDITEVSKLIYKGGLKEVRATEAKIGILDDISFLHYNGITYVSRLSLEEMFTKWLASSVNHDDAVFYNNTTEEIVPKFIGGGICTHYIPVETAIEFFEGIKKHKEQARRLSELTTAFELNLDDMPEPFYEYKSPQEKKQSELSEAEEPQNGHIGRNYKAEGEDEAKANPINEKTFKDPKVVANIKKQQAKERAKAEGKAIKKDKPKMEKNTEAIEKEVKRIKDAKQEPKEGKKPLGEPRIEDEKIVWEDEIKPREKVNIQWVIDKDNEKAQSEEALKDVKDLPELGETLDKSFEAISTVFKILVNKILALHQENAGLKASLDDANRRANEFSADVAKLSNQLEESYTKEQFEELKQEMIDKIKGL